MRGCWGGARSGKSAKQEQKAISYRIPGTERERTKNSLSTFKVNLWDVFATGPYMLLIELN